LIGNQLVGIMGATQERTEALMAVLSAASRCRRVDSAAVSISKGVEHDRSSDTPLHVVGTRGHNRQVW
jgi:hypothetical protein